MNFTHKMKTLLCLLLACLCISPQLHAQLIWPVKGAKAGENILYRPQQYIGNELNFANLFIEVPQGTTIICPADGVVMHFSIGYSSRLTYSMSWRCESNTFDSCLEEIKQNLKPEIKPEYLNGSVSIQLKDKRMLHISGLMGTVPYKTGMQVKAGDVLGVSCATYQQIKEPNICVSISEGGKSADPMTPFGLKSTFIPPKTEVIPDQLTAQQAEEDMKVLLTAYKECYPSLDEIVTDEEMTAFAERARKKYEKGISYNEFYALVESSTSRELVHDSHLFLLTLPKQQVLSKRHYVSVAAAADTLFVGQTHKSAEKYLGRRVVAINGIPDSVLIRRAKDAVTQVEGNNQSKVLNSLLWGIGGINKQLGKKLTFADGEVYVDNGGEWKAIDYRPFLSVDNSYFKRKILNMRKPLYFKILNDSTVLFSLSTFQLNQKQVETVADSLRYYASYPNMIIDVRNNTGGLDEVVSAFVSYFLQEPSTIRKSYSKVMSNGLYPSFAHTLNYSPDEPVFEAYQPLEGKEGFYQMNEASCIQPDSVTNYKGRVYVLTDETSISAASLFPSFLIRNHRAVTVGRETGTGYHYMTAFKFADFRLPNSKIQVRIPLVKCVFDDEVTVRTPEGRGLMPDYEVPATWDEFFLDKPDPVLAKALDLIKEGKYLGPNPFVKADPAGTGSNSLAKLAYVGVGVIAAGSLYLLGRKLKRK